MTSGGSAIDHRRMLDYVPRDQLIDAALLRDLNRRSDLSGLKHLTGHMALLLLTGFTIRLLQGGVWVWPAMFAHGVVLVFLFTPLHESIHRTAFASRRLNDTMGFVIGCLLLLPRDYFRAFHFAHHRFTQDLQRDPELAAPKPTTVGQWLRYVSGLPYWIWQGRAVVAHAWGRTHEAFYTNDEQRRAVIREARLVLAIYGLVLVVSIWSGSLAAVTYWLLPVFLGQPVLRLYLLAEHGLCPLTDDMMENTRTTYTNAVVRFIAWNMPYHIEHHAFPSVPFHALPRLNAAIRDQLKTTASGYIPVQRQILRSMRGAA